MQTRIVSTSDFATSGGIPSIFGSHAFGPVSWMCKKQTSVSFSSTEAESISLDACLRMDGIRALNLWDLVIKVVHSATNKTDVPKEEPRRNPSAVVQPNMRSHIQTKRIDLIPTNIDHVPPNGTHSGPRCYVVCS